MDGIRTQKLTMIAQDPAVRHPSRNRILTVQVELPAEMLSSGPWGHRIQVIDYDASSGVLYKAPIYHEQKGSLIDPFLGAPDSVLLNDPRFHAQNVYVIVSRILARFEFALGRRVGWNFPGHQLKVVPHAFAEANAFYSARDEALLFGYFPASNGKRTIYSCLSHDVVAHETTHALLDGLRERYTDPSSPDQAAFHEGFSDVVAMLSTFSIKDVVKAGLVRMDQSKEKKASTGLIAASGFTAEFLKRSFLLSIAEQMGEELSQVRGQALRQSAMLAPSSSYITSVSFIEPHRRGEILVAAMVSAFLQVWTDRVKPLGRIDGKFLDLERVAEEGARVADYLLTMAIRAIDYCPPVHLEFCDYLSAILTADHEIRPDESGFPIRQSLRESFAQFGMQPSSGGKASEEGLWCAPEEENPRHRLQYRNTHFEALTRDTNEVFRFVWENRELLRLYDGAFTRVLSVRPCLRIGRDGFALRETVAEYIQILDLTAGELKKLKIAAPKGMSIETPVRLYGGGVLVFDEYCQVKFHIHNRLLQPKRQSLRLKYLWEYGFFDKGASSMRKFSHLHRRRAMDAGAPATERW